MGIHNHLATSGVCNNNCVHCMELDDFSAYGVRSRREGNIINAAKLRKYINNGFLIKNSKVVFTGGEPTLNDELPVMASMLKSENFSGVALQTNGRLLSYPDYALELVRSGINEFGISLHGSKPSVHDAVTRTPGSFQQTMRGIENLVLIKRIFPYIKISINTILTRINICDIYSLFFKFRHVQGIDVFVLNPLILSGNGENYADRLLLRYSETASAVAAVFRRLDTEFVSRVVLIDFPRCVGGLQKNIGDFEKVNLIKNASEARELKTKMGYEGVKRTGCVRCRYTDICTGISPVYIKINGWSEFRPVL